jgi:CBS domain containing-hemolysin-like protein
MTLLLCYALLALGVSFLCSMLEATLLSIPRSHVETMAQRGLGWAKRLRTMKTHVDRPLSAILTLNTVAHTVGAAGVGAQAAAEFGSAAVGIASAVMTVLILLLSEIIPKTLGTVHAKSLGAFTTHATRAMMILTYPILVVLERVNRLIGRGGNQHVISRAELAATLRLGKQSGALDEDEYRTVRNLISLDETSVADVLTPRTVVTALPEDCTVADALDEASTFQFARIPIYRESLDEVTGYVTRWSLFESHHAGRDDVCLKDLARPIGVIPEQASVGAAMDAMLADREHILLVVDEFGGAEGIVTLEDALETLLGQEIVDETDRTVNLRDLARRRARDLTEDNEPI